MATVLVVDDDKVVSHLIVSVLREQKHKVIPAYDAVSGLMVATRTAGIDAIVLDINMPGGSGEDTLRRLKMNTRTGQIPVIVLSGSIDDEGRRRVLALGATHALIKPLVPDQLVSALETALADQ